MSTPSLSSSPCPDPRIKDLYRLPPKYKILQVLGEGGFGVVVKCIDLQKKEIVAIKICRGVRNLRNEAIIMKALMDKNLDKKNIIKYNGGFGMYKCLEFEILDINLGTYIRMRQTPMRLKDIRTVIQQLAVAFAALKTTGVIHCDVKTTNIMLVDQEKQPFKVKLIDFGLAIFNSQVEFLRPNQTPAYRAPELIMGHPYSEAIDIWSLGCVMAYMMFGFRIFPGKTNYELLKYMIDLLGPLPNQYFLSGWKWKVYFNQTRGGQWILKTPLEYWGSVPPDSRCYSFRSLDETMVMRLEEDNPYEADERRECVELLKAMLKWDERQRITPSGILNHPFITMSYLNSGSQVNTCFKETKKGLIGLPSRIIKVKQAPPQNRLLLTEIYDDIVSESEETSYRSNESTILEATCNPDDNEDSNAKKNCLKCIYSWMKKNFRCNNEDDARE